MTRISDKQLNPCKHCDDDHPGRRHAGCHSTCEEYILSQAIKAAIKDEIRKKKAEDDNYVAAVVDALNRQKVRQRKGRRVVEKKQ